MVDINNGRSGYLNNGIDVVVGFDVVETHHSCQATISVMSDAMTWDMTQSPGRYREPSRAREDLAWVSMRATSPGV